MSDQACAAAQEAKRLALESADYVERADNEANGGERIRLRDEASAIYEKAVRHKQDTGWFYQAHTTSPHWTHTERIEDE